MSDIEWADPPVSRGGRPRTTYHAEIAAALRANPGRWALVQPEAARSAANQIANGKYAAYRPAGTFEATCRAVAGLPGRFSVYVRYVGESA